MLKKINPLIVALSVALILTIGYIIMNEFGAKTGIDILDKKIFNDITVDCSEIESNFFASKVIVKVRNRSDQTIQGVSVKVVALDKNGVEIKSKSRSLDETLAPQSTIVRTVTVPKRTKQCRCILESTTTHY
jgi:hypothetical protein